jgi:hypothetical protein
MGIWINKWLAIAVLSSILFRNETVFQMERMPHPIHLTVTEIQHNASEKTLEISCKVFTDDFEKILGQNYKTKVDLTNPPDKAAMKKLIDDYIHKHLSVQVDGKSVQFTGIGFEKDQDAVFSYFQVDNIAAVKAITLTNTILFDLYTDEISIMHVTVNGKRKSKKLDYPDKQATYSFD